MLVKGLMKTDKRLEMIGPAESPLSKLNGQYRWQLLLKGKDISRLNRMVRDIQSGSNGIGLDIKVDVDPVNFM